jgi:V/A-type H+-transporting ATPase subunit C
MDSEKRVVENLSSWIYYPILHEMYRKPADRGFFAELENRLYQQYYTDLLRQSGTGNKGEEIFHAYIQWEIDLLNLKNLIRLRTSTAQRDIRPYMVTGGTIRPDQIQQVFSSDNFNQIIGIIKDSPFYRALLTAYGALKGDSKFSPPDADVFMHDLWVQRKRPFHELETVIAHIRLEQMERSSKHYPFTVLPILVYLERKKYEVFNLRAIILGKKNNLSNEVIQRYLVV